VNIASGGTMDTGGATYVQTAGVTRVNGVLSTGSSLVDIRGGTLSGTGLVIGDVRNAGAVAPGNSPGILLVDGNYAQAPAGMLDIEIGGLTVGTEYDQLRVLGNALLAGKLDVEFVNGFNLTTDAEFTILLTGFLGPGQVTGTFDTLDLPGSSLGIWTVDYLSDRVVLDFDVPEPPTYLLVIVGLGIVGMMRRSRRQS
jgi:hypothetical protein